jgi:hypothetical protein
MVMPTWSTAVAVLAATLGGCSDRYWQARLFKPDAPELKQASPEAPFLKAHGKDGSLAVLESWSLDADGGRLGGQGLRFDADRKLLSRGPIELPLSDLALLETNRPETVYRSEVAVLGVVAGATLAVAALCAINPKACFGSCPTFYAGPPGDERLVAEGFSASIARAFEATDVDSIDVPRPLGDAIELTMRNEALETHYVRSARLLAVPRPPGGRVYRAGDRYFPTGRELAPLRCRGAEGDCLADVLADGGGEYLSHAGAADLAEQELIELAFPAPSRGSGLVIRARNSLLNTFVFYQGLAWLGGKAGETMARLETMPPDQAPAFTGWERILARAEVEVWTRSGWTSAGAFGEIGPIARETQLVPLPADLPPGEVKVRLRLTRGNWKLDRVSLAELAGPAVEPTAIQAVEVRRQGAADAVALSRLHGHGARLVSVPGDAWAIRFPLPAGLRDAELFLESRGYYIEWMREQWLVEEDPSAAVALLRDPAASLRHLAPAWKQMESGVEEIFWRSRMGATP